MAEKLVVTSKVKQLAKKKGLRIGADAVDSLSAHVAVLVSRAADAARADKRGTIKERDIPPAQ